MPLQLTVIEARILGSLIEKSATTPDQYPLTLNSLVNACNQISNREPAMNLNEATVARSLATLQEKGLVERRSEPGSRVTKFMHHIEILLGGGTTREAGVICVMLLRGPQTAGQLKTRTERLCDFTSPAEVDAVLQDLSNPDRGPLVARLPRQSGQKETRFMHLFSGELPKVSEVGGASPSISAGVPKPRPITSTPVPAPDRIAQLEKRVAALETELQQLKKEPNS
jgi:uncharacterized protein YceH (UPF0502 family)